MESVLNHAEAVLRQHPTPAMDLSELHRRTRDRIPMGMPSCAGLRRLMESQPQRFRVLDPWDGMGDLREAGDGAAAGSGVLVISLRPHTGPEAGAPHRRLRESVRWVAGGTDLRSRRSAARVYGLLQEGSSAQARLVRRAA